MYRSQTSNTLFITGQSPDGSSVPPRPSRPVPMTRDSDSDSESIPQGSSPPPRQRGLACRRRRESAGQRSGQRARVSSRPRGGSNCARAAVPRRVPSTQGSARGRAPRAAKAGRCALALFIASAVRFGARPRTRARFCHISIHYRATLVYISATLVYITARSTASALLPADSRRWPGGGCAQPRHSARAACPAVPERLCERARAARGPHPDSRAERRGMPASSRARAARKCAGPALGARAQKRESDGRVTGRDAETISAGAPARAHTHTGKEETGRMAPAQLDRHWGWPG